MKGRGLLVLLLSAALTACGQSGTASFGGYVPPVPVPVREVRTGSATITVDAPQGVTPALALRFPDTSERSITQAGLVTFADLTPGEYLLTGSNVRADGFTFAPQFSGSPLQVRSDQTASASVRYVPLGGRLAVNVQAVAGLSPNVKVVGPGSFTRTVTKAGTTVLIDLAACAYTVTADGRLYNGRTYTPTVLTASAEVQAGVTRSVGVTYAVQTTALQVDVDGLPASERAQVRLTGLGTDLSVQDTMALTGLAPGEYILTAEAVTSSAGTFTPDQASQILTLTADQTLTAAVTYR